MTPFENLIQTLGNLMGIPLHVDPHQSCTLEFSDSCIIQIDLNAYGDQLLIGSQLGNLVPGPYREQIFIQALKVNGLNKIRQGTLAYSEKNDVLVLFDYLPLASTTGESLFEFLSIFYNHVFIWKEAIKVGRIPEIQEEKTESGFLGLKR